MDDILKEAIADAKALRATALENAKIALEEAFTPRLKNMLSQKIQSEVENEDEVEEDAYAEEDVEDGHEEMSAEDEITGDEEVSEQDAEVEPELSDEDEEAELSDEDEDELDLNSVIKELEEELDTSAVGDAENKEPSDDASDSSEIGAQGPEGEGADEEGGKENSEDEVVKEPVTEAENGDDKDELEEIDLDEIIKALDEEEADDDKGDKVEELKSTLKEYKDTIGFLREKLNEVNLLNAKLLFSNKLFRAFGLSNQQKLKVVENFDRTTNLREVKLVYATLAESFKKI